MLCLFVRGRNRREDEQNKPVVRTFSISTNDGPSGISSEAQTEPTVVEDFSESLKISTFQKRRSLPVKFVSSSQRKKQEKAFRKRVLFRFKTVVFLSKK